MTRFAEYARRGPDEHRVAAFLLRDEPKELTEAEKSRSEDAIKRRLPLFQRQPMQRHTAGFPRTGICDQRIDTTEPPDRGGEQTPDLCFPGQISLRHQRLSVAKLVAQRFRPRPVFSAM